MDGVSIGKRIQHLRIERNITQAELGHEISVSRDVIAKWENGEREIKAANLITLADFFDVPVDYLLCRTDIEVASPSLTQIEKITGLSRNSIFELAASTGNQSLFGNIDNGPSEDAKEFLDLLNFLIPSLPYSYLLKEFYNLLSIYKANMTLEMNDPNGSWLDIDNHCAQVTAYGGEAVNYLLYQIGNEFQKIVKDWLERKYKKHSKGGSHNAKEGNNTSEEG